MKEFNTTPEQRTVRRTS